jgi:hypothetical protein
MIPDSDRLRQAEEAADAARALAHAREAARHAGVAWSGLAPDAFRARTPENMTRDAATRLAALQHWRQTRQGRLLAAMTEAERAVERVRACIARGLAANDARCGVALGELERAAATARSAMDVPMDAQPSGALSDEPCATSSASNSRSTASPTSSAS